MVKFLSMLFVICFIATGAYAATNTIGGNIQVRNYTDSDADQNKDTKTTGNAKTNEWRTYADLWFKSEINEKLYGKLYLNMLDTKETWGDEANNKDYFEIYEAYFNYMPMDGLNIRAGKQGWKFGNGRVIGTLDIDSELYSQNGLMFSYEMPELFKASLLYSIIENDEQTGTYVEEKAVKSDKFYALWLNTGLVPFLQDLNFVYATKYQSAEAATSKDKIDNTLTTMGVYAAGNAPVGPMTLNYSAEYYMNGGKDKTGTVEKKYKGTFMGFGAKAKMADLYGLYFGVDYMAASGDKGTDESETKAYTFVQDGAAWFFDCGKLFNAFDGDDAGRTAMKVSVGAMPLDKFSVDFDYIMLSKGEKTSVAQLDKYNLAPASTTKAGIATQMVLKLSYTGIENLDLSLAVGKEKANKDNFPNNKDGHNKTKLIAKYTF